MKKKFDFLGLVLTSVFAMWGLGMATAVNYLADQSLTAVFISVLSFILPLLLGFLGLRLSLWLHRKKYQVKRSGGIAKRLLAVLVLTAILSGTGQLLYAIEWQTYTVDTVVETPMKGRHVVLLIDISGSMKAEKDACIEAACQLVEGMDETTTMQVIAFAGAVTERCTSAYLPLTADNKITLQEMIRSVDMAGGTNFNQPLEMAIKTLRDDQDPEYRSMILMLTDGKESVDDAIKGTLTDPDCGIELFTARITDGSDGTDANVQDLISLAVQDFPIAQQADGSVDMSNVLDTFLAAINYQRTVREEHRKLALGSDLLFHFFEEPSGEAYWWRPVIAAAVFGLYAVLVSVAYYGRPGKISLLLSLSAGLITGFALEFEISIFPLPLLICLGGFAVYEIEEVKTDV